jgi:hypothetical protein
MSTLVSRGTTLDRSLGQPEDEVFFDWAISMSRWRLNEWDEVVIPTLLSWQNNPSQFDDEIDPPTSYSLRKALRYASRMKESHEHPPDWVVPSGDGGIYFRRGTPGRALESLQFTSDGKVVYMRTVDCDIVDRRVIEQRS